MRKGLFAGYGVYATNQRLFGVKRLRAAEPIEIGRKGPGDLDIVRELEHRRDFEVRKDDVSSIELQKPPGVFRMGHMRITLKSGQSVEVKVGKQREYEQLKDVVMAFYPEVVSSN